MSSRTPEGEPNTCPVCHTDLAIEPSQPTGDAPCPQCGTLLWFVNTDGGTQFHELEKVEEIREKVRKAIWSSLGITHKHLVDSASFTGDLGADSLDIVQLVMQLEEEFGVTIPDSEAEHIRTVGEAIHHFVRHQLPGN